jgi:hypothetical protein
VSASILTHFAPLEKPRIERNKLHALSDRVCLTVCAGSGGPTEGRPLSREKLEWLRRGAPFQNSVPSPDCIANGVAPLSPKGCQDCFRHGTKATGGEVIRGGWQDRARLGRPQASTATAA